MYRFDVLHAEQKTTEQESNFNSVRVVECVL